MVFFEPLGIKVVIYDIFNDFFKVQNSKNNSVGPSDLDSWIQFASEL